MRRRPKNFCSSTSATSAPARSIEAHLGAGLQLLAGMHQRIALHGTVAAGGGQRQQQALDRSAARHAAAEQTRREDAGVVDDEQIAAAKEASDVGDACVLDLARRTMQDQQARRSTRRRLLRDQFLGKLEVEVVNAHAADSCHGQPQLRRGSVVVNERFERLEPPQQTQ